MKKSPLKKQGTSEVSKIKRTIQALLRELAILRDGGCVLRDSPEAGQCGGFRKDGELILQYDHLNTRAASVSYADERLGVTLCLAHHGGFKKWHKERYDEIVRKLLSPARVKLWDRIKNDNRSYPVYLSDWKLHVMRLEKEIKKLQ